MSKTRRRGGGFLRYGLFAVAAIAGAGFLIKEYVFDSETTVSQPAEPAVQAAFPSSPAQDDPVAKAHFDAAFAQGLSALRAGDASAAAKAFTSAVRLKSDVPAAHVNLGFARLELGEVGAAVGSFEAAIELRPEQANAYYGLAEAYERRGDLDLALGAMRTFVHLTRESDPFRRRALSAIWEWETALGKRPQPELAKATAQSEGSGDVVPADLLAVELVGLNGKAGRLSAFAGKTIILNIWATWCAPCRAELPSLQRLSDALDPDAFVVVGLSTDADPDHVREFLRETNVTYPNYLDPKRQVATDILGIDSYPQTFIILPDGRLAARISGARSWDHPDMVAMIREGRPVRTPLASE